MTGYPEFLYCYFPIESGIQFLETLKFRLSAISDFNDPFESLLITDYPLLFLSLTSDTSSYRIDRRIEELDKKEFFVVCSNVRNKANGIVNLMKNVRIGCFSETCNNILMWAHYGRKFTGLVVKFKVSMGAWGNDLKKVHYTDERISISNFNAHTYGANDQERQLLTTKSSHWGYEQEWRYIKPTEECKTDESGYYKPIARDTLCEVIVGCRISSTKLSQLKRIIEKLNHTPNSSQIELKIAVPSRSSYSLEIKNLSFVEYMTNWKG